MVSQDIITAACARALITPSHTVELQQSVAARNTGKVTRLLLSRTVESRDQCAVLCAAKPSVSEYQFLKAPSGVYTGSRIV